MTNKYSTLLLPKIKTTQLINIQREKEKNMMLRFSNIPKPIKQIVRQIKN